MAWRFLLMLLEALYILWCVRHMRRKAQALLRPRLPFVWWAKVGAVVWLVLACLQFVVNPVAFFGMAAVTAVFFWQSLRPGTHNALYGRWFVGMGVVMTVHTLSFAWSLRGGSSEGLLLGLCAIGGALMVAHGHMRAGRPVEEAPPHMSVE